MNVIQNRDFNAKKKCRARVKYYGFKGLDFGGRVSGL